MHDRFPNILIDLIGINEQKTKIRVCVCVCVCVRVRASMYVKNRDGEWL